MRVTSDTPDITITPGRDANVELDIVNTSTVIDGITARVVGLPVQHISTRPAELPLFPDAAGRMTVTIGLPSSFPAGQHPVMVEVLSRQPETSPAYVDLDLTVPQAPSFTIATRPALVRARRTGTFIVSATNRGNVALDVHLTATDPDKQFTTQVQPAVVHLPPGATASTVLTVRSRRKIMGAEADLPLSVTAAGRVAAPSGPSTESAGAAGVASAAAADPLEPDADDLTRTAALTFRRRPYLTRGVLTALILVAIVALWAAVFLFGLAKVFASDPMTKAAPASFFAATPSDAGDAGSTGAPETGPGAGSNGGSSATGEAAPAGALPKSGTLPAGVGGSITGTVAAASSGEPVGRVLVEALRVKADGSTVTASSAATQSDGSYEVAGLFPGPYLLKFSADGFETSYYPDARSQSAAKRITADAGEVNANGNGVVVGEPATITGKVDLGDAPDDVTTTVSARLLQQGTAGDTTIPDVEATQDGDQATYTLADVPAPGHYLLTFHTDGYESTSVQAIVNGGSTRYESTVIMSAGDATLSGYVTDGDEPLGGATVSTTVDGKEVSTTTPTSGKVGKFVLNQLPSPATYVLTVAKDGYGKTSQVIDVIPGKGHDDLTVALHAGNGVVTGVVKGPSGDGVGGATVTVGGMTDPPSTVTLTDGKKGSFQLTDLPVPGSYTLTFSHDGYADQIVPVTLSADEALTPLTVTMSPSSGTIRGTVADSDGQGLAGATVTATDGAHSWPATTTSSQSGPGAGNYVISDLPPGTYTVTATGPNSGPETASGSGGQTAMLTVSAGKSAQANFRLGGP